MAPTHTQMTDMGFLSLLMARKGGFEETGPKPNETTVMGSLVI